MSIYLCDFNEIIEQIAPAILMEPWDNSGLQLKSGDGPIAKILVSLDITAGVIQEAIDRKADLILSHHPLIFKELRRIDNNNFIDNQLIRLIKCNISVYCAHTNFDSVQNGNNDYLAGLLGLKNIRPLLEGNPSFYGSGMGRIGSLPAHKTLAEMVTLVKNTLDIRSPINCVGDARTIIRTVALCTGSGGDMAEAALRLGCELLITGDVKHHAGCFAKETGLSIIDAGHYHTEKIFIKNMADLLKIKLENKVEILESEVDQNPFYMV